MEFILLIFVNIIMGAIFYLILRIKLEKHATDYREKRLKREMDEIIFEFNETAERNISILENRIDYLKKLMEKSDQKVSIDVCIDDAKKAKKGDFDVSGNNYIYGQDINDQSLTICNDKMPENKSLDTGLISKYFFKMKYSLEKSLNTIIKHRHNKDLSLNQDKSFGGLVKMQSENMTYSDQLIERSDIYIIPEADQISMKQKKEDAEFSETELGEMFSVSEDKYLLISDLYNKGYSSEIISRCSGIPIGEIQLVLDLNNSL